MNGDAQSEKKQKAGYIMGGSIRNESRKQRSRWRDGRTDKPKKIMYGKSETFFGRVSELGIETAAPIRAGRRRARWRCVKRRRGTAEIGKCVRIWHISAENSNQGRYISNTVRESGGRTCISQEPPYTAEMHGET